MSNSIKSSPVTTKILSAGLIAGMIAGVAMNITRIIEALLGLPTAIPGMLTVETALYHLGYEVAQFGIFGLIFSIFYSMFYNAIPSKGVKKGIIFGVIIFLFSNLFISSSMFWYALLTGIEQYILWTFTFLLAIFSWIPYGVTLGILYERWK